MFKLTNLIVLMSMLCVVAIAAAPYQELPHKPGYVPVYIREGNTPLSQVNPKLVEAFREDEESNQLQIEADNPREVKVADNDKPDDVAEHLAHDDEETKEQSKQVNEDNVNEELNSQKQERNHDQEHEQAHEEEEEVIGSDIAEFTSDDIKTLADGKTDN